ncbi:hypothetical protein FWG95_01175 [Candidatus Saccharibacteria bacterium]|nr:hypothetical protein [Candidatus Saccharibacteria bacterium]
MLKSNKQRREQQKARDFSRMRFQNYRGAPLGKGKGRSRRDHVQYEAKDEPQKVEAGATEEKIDQEAPSFQFNTTLSTFHGETRGERTERQRDRDRQLRKRKLGIFFISVGVVLGLVMMIMTQFSGRLTTVTSNAPSMNSESAETYKGLVEEYLTNYPFERFSFVRRDKAFSEFVIEKAPEILKIKVSSSGIASSKLELEFRSSVAMWTNGAMTSYVDASGVVFERNHFAEPSVTIADNSGLAPIDGVAASARFLSFVGQVTAEIAKANGGTVDRVVIPRGAVRFVEFYLAGRPYPFKAQIDRDPVSQAADIMATARYLDEHGIVPNYVDVRVVGKGFWK